MKMTIRQFGLNFLLVLPFVSRAADALNSAIAPHARDLVSLQSDQSALFKSQEFLKARYTILYFGAGWCVDCLRFSPSLVRAYDAQPKGTNRF
jgi:hypothetical protein